MGVDTRLYINNSWRIEDIKDVIQKRLEVTDVKTEFHDWAPDYVIIKFTMPSDNTRMLHIHTHANVGGFPAVCLSLRSNPEGCGILKTLVETFGGFFQEADVDDNFEAFQKPGEGNIDFVVRQAIKDDPSLGDDDKRMAKYLTEEKWRANSVWHKPQKG